jgi:protein involved in sex pheromone biosynthesis
MSSIPFFKPVARSSRKPVQRYGIMPKIQIGPATLGVITILIILLMSLLYLIQANSTATKGYEIEKEQEKMKKLDSQAEKLELEMARLRSTKELEGIPEKLNLIPYADGTVGSVQLGDIGAVAGVTSDNAPGLNPKR